MKLFFESYECKIDDKGRVKLPAHLVRSLQEEGISKLVVKRSVFQQCIEAYPPNPWEEIMQKINGLNRFIKNNADFIRTFTAGVRESEIDASERILITKDLKSYAHLQKDLVINGVGNFFEIWDKETYEKNLAASAEDFSVLAESVMGTSSNETLT